MPIPQTQFVVFAFSTSTSQPVSNDEANITAELRKDYGSFAATDDVNPTPISGKPGFYRFDLTAGERDVSIELRIFPTTSTNAMQVIGVPPFYEGPEAKGGSVSILPAVGIVADRSPGATINPVVGETISQSITLYATDGTTPINLSGKTLAIVFENLQGGDVAIVSSGNITITGTSNNVVTFAYPSAVTAAERTLRFAIRDAAAPLTMYLQGLCVVTRAPQVDP